MVPGGAYSGGGVCALWRPPPDGYCCGRYASYWNAFLLLIYCGLLFVAADQTRMMQDQMSGAAMAMPPDPSKAFKVNHRILVSTCLYKEAQRVLSHTEILMIPSVGVSRRYTDHYQGRGQSTKPTGALINIHEHLI